MLITAKGDEHMASIDKIDGRDDFESAVQKWKKISTKVMEAGHSGHLRNRPACKDKWGVIFGDLKRINGY